LHITQFAKCLQFLSYLNWRPAGHPTFQLGTQNEGNCRICIIRLRITCICQYEKCM